MSKNTCIFTIAFNILLHGMHAEFDVLPWNKSINEFFIFSLLTIALHHFVTDSVPRRLSLDIFILCGNVIAYIIPNKPLKIIDAVSF